MKDDSQSQATAVGVETAVGVVAFMASEDAATVGDGLINVEGNLSTAIIPISFVVEGGGISEASTLRFLPLGAGSRGGDLLYVTVLVITDRTLTGLEQALLGALSK